MNETIPENQCIPYHPSASPSHDRFKIDSPIEEADGKTGRREDGKTGMMTPGRGQSAPGRPEPLARRDSAELESFPNWLGF